MTQDTPLDVAIVGAGPCGLAAAIALGRVGRSARVFDGSCLVSSIAGYPTYMTFFSTAERIAIGGLPFAVAGEKPTRREALAYYRLVASHFALDVRQYEAVTGIERADNGFLVHTQPRGLAPVRTPARAVVVATGYFDSPNLLGVPGESLPHVSHRFREGHEAYGQPVVVVGGGNSAVDAALDLYRAEARVTLVHFGPELDPNVKPWVRPDAENRIAEGSIQARWRSRVVAIDAEAVTIRAEDGGGEERLPARHVYLMTGYTPDPALLRSLGVTFDGETGVPTHDPATMETNVPGVYVAGVIVSGYRANSVFIENGRGHGDLIARHLSTRTTDRHP